MSDHESPHSLRLFFAIELPDDARCSAAAVACAVRSGSDGDALRWVRPEAYHVTLRFLGEVGAIRVPELVRAARAQLSKLAPFEIRLGAPCALPQRGRVKVLALELEPAEPIARLAAKVESTVVAQGFSAEGRAFRPHLSLARVRRGQRFRALKDAPSPEPAPFVVQDIALIRSQLGPAGAAYTALERVALGAETHPSSRLHD